MSRLYGTVQGDTRQKPATSGGNREITAVLRYGSAGNSMVALSATVFFNPDDDAFKLLVEIPGESEASYLLGSDGRVEYELWKVALDG